MDEGWASCVNDPNRERNTCQLPRRLCGTSVKGFGGGGEACSPPHEDWSYCISGPGPSCFYSWVKGSEAPRGGAVRRLVRASQRPEVSYSFWPLE